MIFSKTSKIAIKAVSFLASQANLKSHRSVKEIAEEIEESEHTLGKTLQLLVKANVINSSKGPTGGFYMEAKQLTIPILKIIAPFEEKFISNKCVLGFKKCNALKPCALHTEFKKAKFDLDKILTKTRIADLNAGKKKLVVV